MPEDIAPLIPPHPSGPPSPMAPSYSRPFGMEKPRAAPLDGAIRRRRHRPVTLLVVSSYVFDWLVLLAVAILGAVLGRLEPNKRPFQLENPDISFPYTEHETVSSLTLVLCNTVIPIVVIAVISLVFVPGATVPRGTPPSLIWKRKFWEMHVGWLGLGLSLASAWFITNGVKNIMGKPRPDLVSRCQPDLPNLAQYIVGGLATSSSNGQLVSGAICKNPDNSLLQDGFRSFPSGHSSSSAAGLIYLTLFIASKFAITIPFLAPAGYADESSFSAYPSRVPGPTSDGEAYELASHHGRRSGEGTASATVQNRLAQHTTSVSAARRQAAAPPLYLLVVAALPFFGAVFIACSRWVDFRHHGFDILFGFGIGTATAIFAFRYYHLPLGHGAGWAWGPRSHDKAFWAGVGSFSYATSKFLPGYTRQADEEEALDSDGIREIATEDENIGESSGVNYSRRSSA